MCVYTHIYLYIYRYTSTLLPAKRRCRHVVAAPPAAPVESLNFQPAKRSISRAILLYIYLSFCLSIVHLHLHLYHHLYSYIYIFIYAYFRITNIPAMRRYRRVTAAPPAAHVESRDFPPAKRSISLSVCLSIYLSIFLSIVHLHLYLYRYLYSYIYVFIYVYFRITNIPARKRCHRVTAAPPAAHVESQGFQPAKRSISLAVPLWVEPPHPRPHRLSSRQRQQHWQRRTMRWRQCLRRNPPPVSLRGNPPPVSLLAWSWRCRTRRKRRRIRRRRPWTRW